MLGVEDGMKHACAVNLHNVVTLPATLVGRRVGALSDERMAQVCAAIAFALGCEG